MRTEQLSTVVRLALVSSRATSRTALVGRNRWIPGGKEGQSFNIHSSGLEY